MDNSNTSILPTKEKVNSSDTTKKYSMQESQKNTLTQDNQGRKLSKQQQEYFKDSKVRDEDGNLLTVYHGTPYEFNQFKYDKLGENTSSLGAGFYFTDKIETAKEYKQDGNLKEVYLDIKKPLKYKETTITKDEYKEFIKAIDKETKGTYLIDYDGIENALMEYDYGGDDIDLVSAVQSATGLTHERTFEILRNTIGYDGIISNVDFLNKGETLYVAFNSNQIKNANNINPTKNPDIRYSQETQGTWQEYLKDTSINKGTKESLEDVRRIPINKNLRNDNEIQKAKVTVPLSETLEAEINLKKFKEDNDIKNDVITENKQEVPISEEKQEEKVAKILTETPEKVKESERKWAILKANILDKGIVFEELSRKTKNRDLQGKWDYTLSATARGQNAIGNARYEFDSETKTRKQLSKSLEEIRSEVGDNVSDFSNYMYHLLNIDRMTLEERFGGDTGINYERKKTIENKPVFGKNITAEYSRQKVADFEKNNPNFKSYAQDVYDFLNTNKAELVKNGVISQEASDYMSEMYPHYVPIARVDKNNNSINVPLDSGKTGINSPIKAAKGGNSDILPLFDTIAQKTLQTYRASARNNFGVELKNTLNTITNSEQVNVDNIIETMGQTIEEQNLLQKGENGQSPTFTVFENGKRVTYKITKDMYDALKPVSDSSILGKTFKPLNKISNFRRGVLTEYNPLFSIINAIKDGQDVLVNSQHAAKTYSKFPEAYVQIVKKGYWYQEYIQNGGEQNSYFNANDNIFESDVKKSKTKNILRIPLDAISSVNNVIELAPRLSEYIASREKGVSIETSMLDASRVTTNFKAGGDVTKFANRNGATFLNASVQGAMQAVRNIQEANMKGLKGWTVLACKTTIAGLPAVILNNFIWGNDDDYDELQDYVKDNYYCIAKYGNGKFIRIPKGRALATIQKVVSSTDKYITDGKEINIDNLTKDFWECLMFAKDNLAPNNPIDNNVASPITQVMTNTSWYGEDIVPSRLQDKPKAEQYDETTDSFSILIGKILNVSPYKVNYLLDQYGGGISDVVLPLMTKQAENNPIEDKFTTDSTMKSKYPGEFFEKADELKANANSSEATNTDKIKYLYISDVQSDLSNLYTKKREIQNANISDENKKKLLKEVQKQINEIAKNGLNSLDNLKVEENTAVIGNNQYYKELNLKTNEMEWTKLTEKQKAKNNDISLKTYVNYKNEINRQIQTKRKIGELTEEQSLKNTDKVDILLNSSYSDKEKTAIYENYIRSKPKDGKLTTYDIMKFAGININEYLKYTQQGFESDKEDDGTLGGKTVSGSSKEKTYNYVNKMNISYEQRLLLLGTQYKLNASERTILSNYVQSLNITNKEKLEVLNKCKGFTVYKNGNFNW